MTYLKEIEILSWIWFMENEVKVMCKPLQIVTESRFFITKRMGKMTVWHNQSFLSGMNVGEIE